MNFFTESILTGFALYSFIYVLFPKSRLGAFKNLDRIACLTFSIGGLIILSAGVYHLFSYQFLNSDSVQQRNMSEVIFGKYWFTFWLIPAKILITTQLMWIKQLRENKIVRLLVSALTLFSLESYLVILISKNREYLPSSWTMSLSAILLDWLTYFLVFVVGVMGIYLLNRRFFRKI